MPPSGEGCVESLAAGGWWLHLRRCAECGHIGCCDSSPSQHALKHFHATGHPIAASFEPGETWFYDYRTRKMIPGQQLAGPAVASGRSARARTGRQSAAGLGVPAPLSDGAETPQRGPEASAMNKGRL
ncbi:MAG TPA: UBP-type zinc finger domain-containing protein [Bryobacteraceae bacterium]